MTATEPKRADVDFEKLLNRTWNKYRHRQHKGHDVVLVDPEFFDVVRAEIARLREQLRVMREALEFYATEGNWQDDIAPDPAGTPVPYSAPIYGDYGSMAKDALTRSPGGV